MLWDFFFLHFQSFWPINKNIQIYIFLSLIEIKKKKISSNKIPLPKLKRNREDSKRKQVKKREKKSISRYVEQRWRRSSAGPRDDGGKSWKPVRSYDNPSRRLRLRQRPRRHPSPTPELPPIDRQLLRTVSKGRPRSTRRLLLHRERRVRERVEPGLEPSLPAPPRATTAARVKNLEAGEKQFGGGRSTASFQRRSVEPLEGKQLRQRQANAVR